MARQRYQLDARVIVDFGGGEEYTGEIDAIDFEGDPEHPYRVWYDVPHPDENYPGLVLESEWVSPSMLRKI